MFSLLALLSFFQADPSLAEDRRKCRGICLRYSHCYRETRKRIPDLDVRIEVSNCMGFTHGDAVAQAVRRHCGPEIGIYTFMDLCSGQVPEEEE